MAFRLERAAIEGILIARSDPVEDERGSFLRTFDAAVLRELGLPATVEQASISRNRAAGTLRGMHWQQPPHAETKLIRCSRGAVFDVLADVRPSSPTYGGWLAWELREEEPLMLVAGTGIAHGFQTLSDDAELTYLISTAYEPAAARGARWNDPLLGIEWPEPPAERVISERDRSFPDLADAPDPGAPA